MIDKIKIPKIINESEIIVRTIFSDLVKKDSGEVRPNAFSSYPKDADEVSVNRLTYTTVDFCKFWSKTINKKGYCGLASIFAKSVFDIGATIVASPILPPNTPDNKYHADIKIGYKQELGKPLPQEFSQKIKHIAKQSKFHQDLCPDNNTKWCGEKVIPNP